MNISGEPILIFGGSFDPVHFGHIESSIYVAKELKIPEIIFVPSGKSPLKDRKLTEPHHRINMLNLALEDMDFATIEDFETKKDGPSYTHITLDYILKKHQRPLYLLMGADQAVVFQSWKNTDRICDLCTPVAMTRASYGTGDLKNWDNLIIEVADMNISSTKLRDSICHGDVDMQNRWLAKSVIRYIKDHSLYSSSPVDSMDDYVVR